MTDFLDEIVSERTAKNPDFPKMVEKADANRNGKASGDKMTEDELRAIEARANAATPGPWEERWLPVIGCDGYQVSDFGNVRSRMRGGNHKIKRAQEFRLLSQSAKGRYRTVSIPRNGSYSTKTVHSLVMESFVGPRPVGQEIAHLNGDPGDNRLSNLVYCSHVENERHKVAHGTRGSGDKNSNARLQGWQVAEIKYLSTKSISHAKIGALFDISYKNVSAIVNGGAWQETKARLV